MSKNKDKDSNPQNSKTIQALAHFSQIGLTMAASVFIGVLLGKYLDRLLGTSPWMILIFSILGVVTAIRSLFNIRS